LQFTVGTSRFAVPLSVLEEVRTAVPVAPIPGAPAELAGVFSLRGELALALDLLRLLGLAVPADLPACRHLLVLRARASSVGLAISELKAVRRVAPAALHPPTEAGLAALGSHALGVTTDGVVLLDWRQICRLPIFQSL
jgi:purine-binding chemotaxis protein CheW